MSQTRTFSSNVTDPVADLLTRVRNANLAYKDELIVPVSKQNESVLKILDAEGYVDGFSAEGEGVHRAYRVRLKYGKNRQRTITGIKRVSKPGRRVYVGRDELPRVLGGLGVAIVSTSQGVMTDKDASRKGIGGEVLAFVW
ncbi:MAG TPA: 30S ribosomal protein S8 [Actinomycetota bacterium]|nr:30S ribosomal protein S8 [Actinomycetota bacterium]